MTHATKTNRGTGVTLTLGLMSITVSLYNRTAEYKTTRGQFTTIDTVDPVTGEVTSKDYRVGRQNVAKDPETGEILLENGVPVAVENSAIEYKYATDYGYVFVSDSEIEELLTIEPRSAKVVAFQPLSVWNSGAYIPTGQTFEVEVTPIPDGKRKVPNRNGLLQFQVLLETMEQRGAFAVLDVVSRGIPTPAALLPDGTLWYLRVEEEIREPRGNKPDVEVPAEWRPVVGALLDAMWRDEPLSLHDTRVTAIQNFADEKASKGDFSKPEEPEVPDVVPQATVDILALLQASVDAAKASGVAKAS